MDRAVSKKKVFTFLAITLTLSSIFYYLIISNGSIYAYGGGLTAGLMWCPGLAGMATQIIYTRSARGLGWKPGKVKYLLLALAIPLVYCLVVYGFTWITGLGGFPNPEFVQSLMGGAASPTPLQIAISLVIFVLVNLVVGLVTGLGEEIGWRGLFVPELAKLTTFNRAALISGAVWALWHMPLLFFAGYNLPGAPRWYAGLMFAIMVIGISFAFAWLRLKSGSLWPAALLHASHNVFVQAVFTPLTIATAVSPYIIDEFGIGLALAAVVLALVFARLGYRQAAVIPA